MTAVLAPVSLVIDTGTDVGDQIVGSPNGAAPEGLAGVARVGSSMIRRAALLDATLLWNQLDALAEQMAPEGSLGTFSVGAAAGVTAVFSAGYVAWCLRSGALLASAISSLPMWRAFDPLPVLEFWEKKEGRRKERDDEQAEEPLEKLVQSLV